MSGIGGVIPEGLSFIFIIAHIVSGGREVILRVVGDIDLDIDGAIPNLALLQNLFGFLQLDDLVDRVVQNFLRLKPF